jgi:hypothetical protein
MSVVRTCLAAMLLCGLLGAAAIAETWDYTVVAGQAGYPLSGVSHALINGQPAISFIDVEHYALKYAYLGEDGWHVSSIPGVSMPTGNTSLAEVGGGPAIAFQDDSMIGIYYARLSDGGWVIEEVAYSQVAHDCSLAVRGDGRPGIAYMDSTGLRYAARTEDGWSSVPIDGQFIMGGQTSIVYREGMFAISYYADGSLRLARQMCEEIQITTLDSEGDVGQYNSIALIGPNAKIGVSYYDATNGALKYVEVGTGEPCMVTVDSGTDVGMYSSLADLDGGPAIAYYEAPSGHRKAQVGGRLKFARRDADGWHVRRLPEHGDLGTWASLAVGDGPTIATVDSEADQIIFARAHQLEGRAVMVSALPQKAGVNSTSQISAYVSNADGPVEGLEVEFEVTWTDCGVELAQASAVTDASGIAAVTLDTGEQEGFARVVAHPVGWDEQGGVVVQVGEAEAMRIEYLNVKVVSVEEGLRVTGKVRVTNVHGEGLTLIEATPPLLDAPGAIVVTWGLPESLEIYEVGQYVEAPFEFIVPQDTYVFHCYVTFSLSDWVGRRRGHDRAYEGTQGVLGTGVGTD